MFYIYKFHFGIIISAFYSKAVVPKCSLKLFLKMSQNSQENTCTGVSFLSATSNFINEETPAQCFSKPLTIFAKSPIANSDWVLNIPLYYLLAKVHRM